MRLLRRRSRFGTRVGVSLGFGIIALLFAIFIALATQPIPFWYTNKWRVTMSDMNVACAQQYGPTFHETLLAQGALSWKCTNGALAPGVLKAVNVYQYCTRNHPGSTTKYLSTADPDSWYCYR